MPSTCNRPRFYRVFVLYQEEEEDIEDDVGGGHRGGGPRRHRKRHRRMYRAIGEQMDFYFGDANLAKSKFLSQEIAEKGPWLDMNTFLKFNKLAEMLRYI